MRKRVLPVLLALLPLVPSARAAVIRQEQSRFDAKVIHEPTGLIGQVGEAPESVPGFSAGVAGWAEFSAKSGGTWNVRIDRRSGTPLFVEGPGIPWFDANSRAMAPADLETVARAFIKENSGLLGVRDAELVFDAEGSGAPVGNDRYTLLFRREVQGIPVENERFLMFVVRGNLVSFGADRWGAIESVPQPVYGVETSRDLLMSYMGINRGDTVEEIESGTLVLTPAPVNDKSGAFKGAVGEGITHRLARRFVIRVIGEPASWVGKVDAVTGQVFALYDDTKYAQAKGWVYPMSSDGDCPLFGCNLPAYPMPYANMTVNAIPTTTNDQGVFTCSGGLATTALAGPYVRIADTCGAVNESVACDADLDLFGSAGTNCTRPAGHSAGDTNASRTAFWDVNRVKEKGRYWLPANVWLQSQLVVNTNQGFTCNAIWNGALNMYRAGDGCRNTAEIAGVLNHEYGHGLDENDGGGFDNTSEAYADAVAIISDRASCVGRGFYEAQFCSGYGDACLSCTGIRDMDYTKRTANTPATPQNFTSPRCPSGGGPCGKESHCEAYVPAEAVFDLATRDLPASGMDPVSAWQLTERLFYKSRQGSGGNIFNCTLPDSDGCNVGGWFNTMRIADDDDGNLANGTPHAAAIYAAFARHNIACGTVGQASNQSTSTPAVTVGTLTGSNGSNAVVLSWVAGVGASSYVVMRSDVACSETMNIIAEVAAPNTQYTDTGLPNGFTYSYRVHARGSNIAWESPVSNCVQGTPHPFSGTILFNAGVYACGATIQISVADANIGAPTTTVAISSNSEPVAETVVLTETPPGSALFVGSITSTSAPSGNGDNLLQIANGDTITATYIDANDGQGGVNVPRVTNASADCIVPVITNVQSSVIGNSARITWDTNEAATSVVRYGTVPPPASTASVPALVVAHTSDLTGLQECAVYYYSVESADAAANLATDDNAGAYYTFETGRNVNRSFPSADTPVSIPDENTTGGTSTINVTDIQTVIEVKVRVYITHTWDGSLALELITPNGTTVALSTHRGGGGDNYENTVFDDAAAAAISSGAAPFSGTFRPDSPLAAATGIPATGAWKLKVVDDDFGTVGTINNWSLILRYPEAPCGPHAKFRTEAMVADACTSGGPGAGNGIWDAGENVDFSVTLENDGTVALTGVSATLIPTTPGVTMAIDTATYRSIGIGATAASDSPHFRALLPAGMACGSAVNFDVQVTANEGSWTSSASPQGVGFVFAGAGDVLNENFSLAFPGAWTIVDGGSGGGIAATWTVGNPGSRSAASPITSPFAIVDSRFAGQGATQDEQLISQVLDLSAATSVSLQFDQWLRRLHTEKGDVDVRSSLTGGVWVNVLSNTTGSTPNPDHRTIDLTAQAAGAANVQVRFHYYDASIEYWWIIDNVKVSYIAPPGCYMDVCAGGPPPPPPVPDGTYGQAITASRATADGSTLDLTWDVSTCTGDDYHVVYGDLATVGSYAVSGGACNLGISGSASWAGVPAGDLWYVIVADDDVSLEGSWGDDSAGDPRNGAAASNQCSISSRSNDGSCP